MACNMVSFYWRTACGAFLNPDRVGFGQEPQSDKTALQTQRMYEALVEVVLKSCTACAAPLVLSLLEWQLLEVSACQIYNVCKIHGIM